MLLRRGCGLTRTGLCSRLLCSLLPYASKMCSIKRENMKRMNHPPLHFYGPFHHTTNRRVFRDAVCAGNNRVRFRNAPRAS